MRQLTVFVVLCAVLLAGCGDQAGVPGSAVATVDGEAIGRRAFDHWLAVAAKSSGRPGAQVPKPPDYVACVAQKRKAQPAGDGAKVAEGELRQQCKQEYGALRDQVLQLLVSSRWLEGEARDRGITVGDAEVAEAFERQRKLSFPEDADFQAFLEHSGQTEQDIRTRVRLDLLSTKIREQVTKAEGNVTDEQIADYYRKSKAQFAKPARRDLRIVLTKTRANAERAMSTLAAGDSWSSVAAGYSIDETSKSQGGRLAEVAAGQQEKALDDAVFKTRPGRIAGPVKTRAGYYVFEVTNVMRAAQQTLEQATPAIRQLLLSQSRQEKLDDFTERFRDKWKARTECREGYATPDCSNGPRATPTPAAQQP